MITKIQAWLSKVPLWLQLPVTTFLGAALSYVMMVPQADLLHDLSTQAGLACLVKGMVAAGLVALANLLKPATKVEQQAVRDKLARLSKAAITVLALGAALAGGGSALCACHPSAPPSVLPADLLSEAECVGSEIIAGDVDVGAIATKCTKGILAIAVDLVDWLLSDLKFAADHQAAAEKLLPQVHDYRKTHPVSETDSSVWRFLSLASPQGKPRRLEASLGFLR